VCCSRSGYHAFILINAKKSKASVKLKITLFTTTHVHIDAKKCCNYITLADNETKLCIHIPVWHGFAFSSVEERIHGDDPQLLDGPDRGHLKVKPPHTGRHLGRRNGENEDLEKHLYCLTHLLSYLIYIKKSDQGVFCVVSYFV